MPDCILRMTFFRSLTPTLGSSIEGRIPNWIHSDRDSRHHCLTEVLRIVCKENRMNAGKCPSLVILRTRAFKQSMDSHSDTWKTVNWENLAKQDDSCALLAHMRFSLSQP